MIVPRPVDIAVPALVVLGVGWHVVGTLIHEPPSGAASPSDLLALAVILAHRRAIQRNGGG